MQQSLPVVVAGLFFAFSFLSITLNVDLSLFNNFQSIFLILCCFYCLKVVASLKIEAKQIGPCTFIHDPFSLKRYFTFCPSLKLSLESAPTQTILIPLVWSGIWRSKDRTSNIKMPLLYFSGQYQKPYSASGSLGCGQVQFRCCSERQFIAS